MAVYLSDGAKLLYKPCISLMCISCREEYLFCNFQLTSYRKSIFKFLLFFIFMHYGCICLRDESSVYAVVMLWISASKRPLFSPQIPRLLLQYVTHILNTSNNNGLCQSLDTFSQLCTRGINTDWGCLWNLTITKCNEQNQRPKLSKTRYIGVALSLLLCCCSQLVQHGHYADYPTGGEN